MLALRTLRHHTGFLRRPLLRACPLTTSSSPDPTNEDEKKEPPAKTPFFLSQDADLKDILYTGATCFGAIGVLSALNASIALPLLGSYGASAILVYGAPKAPFSQPRNVVGGHAIAATVGIAAHQFIAVPFDALPLAAPIAVSTAAMLMMATRTVHPPAGGTALISLFGSPTIHALGFQFVIPAAGGAALLCLGGLVHGLRGTKYPVAGWW